MVDMNDESVIMRDQYALCRAENRRRKSGDMDDDAVKQRHCSAILKTLMKHRFGWIFNHIVDPKTHKIPSLFDLESNPSSMDLGTVKAKLENGRYSTADAFASDVRLTFSNVMRHGPSTTAVYRMAKEMSDRFEMVWKLMAKRCDAEQDDRIVVDSVGKGSGSDSDTFGSRKRAKKMTESSVVVVDNSVIDSEVETGSEESGRKFELKAVEKRSDHIGTDQYYQSCGVDCRRDDDHVEVKKAEHHDPCLTSRGVPPRDRDSDPAMLDINKSVVGDQEALDQSENRWRKFGSVRQHCSAILKGLMNHRFGWIFNHVVDPKSHKIPSYFDFESNSSSMNLGRVKAKLENDLYSTTNEFATDVRLVFSEVMRYSPSTKNAFYRMAKEMSNYFEIRWKRMAKEFSVEHTAHVQVEKAEHHEDFTKTEQKKRALLGLDELIRNQRESSRIALLQVENSAEIDKGRESIKELDMLCGWRDPSLMHRGLPLRKLGLFLKADFPLNEDGKEEQ
ncbi:Bromodomain containing protein [Trema orientale]|uniref:Bromodomain containing protein n=1 Tax=Trema orientale TaxID=63057 RepID=A0A2P5BXV3_TREOI|nr:Bromodomain containing protein [Trema orientale]